MGIYNEGWKGKLLESIRVCKSGNCQAIAVLACIHRLGTDDYSTTLNKTPVMDSAIMVAWVDLESMSAEAATEQVCQAIMNL